MGRRGGGSLEPPLDILGDQLLLAHSILVLVALASSQGSGETAHLCCPARAFAACTHISMNVEEGSFQNIDL